MSVILCVLSSVPRDINEAVMRCREYVVPQEILGRDVYFLIGNTQSGKSTAYEYLQGNPLVIHNHLQNVLEAHLVDSANRENSEIGSGEVSKTLWPRAISLSPNDRNERWTLCDLPGFLDSRDSHVALLAAYTSKKCIQSAVGKKIILTVSEPLFNATGGEPLRQSINIAGMFVPVSTHLYKHSLFLLSRSFFNVDIPNVGEMVKRKTNGRLLNDWPDNAIAHLPAAGMVGNHLERYNPTGPGPLEMRLHILEKIQRINRLSSNEEINVEGLFSDENARGIQNWCALNPLRRLWNRCYNDEYIQCIRFTSAENVSRDKFVVNCESRVKLLMLTDPDIKVLLFVSDGIVVRALRQTKENFSNTLGVDIDFINKLRLAINAYHLERENLNVEACVKTGLTAGGATGVIGGCVYATGMIVGGTMGGVVLLPAIVSCIAVGMYAKYAGWWDPWSDWLATTSAATRERNRPLPLS